MARYFDTVQVPRRSVRVPKGWQLVSEAFLAKITKLTAKSRQGHGRGNAKELDITGAG